MDNAISILVSAAVTIAAAWWFYKRAGDELRIEAGRLRHETRKARDLTNLVLHALEEGRVAKLMRDEDGNFTGLELQGTLSLSGEATFHAEAAVDPGEDDSNPPS